MPNPSPQDAADARGSDLSEYQRSVRRFWTGNIAWTLSLLFIWALAGLGCGVLFADWLNQYRVGGYPLGFWFAQQGSIVVFVLLILVFCLVMNRRDARHHAELEAFKKERK